MLDKLTIVIPTHNSSERMNYINRALEYYSSFSCMVILCDSSLAVIDDSNFPANVKYHHVPGVNFVGKIMGTIEIIETEFVACCADDDFLLLDALQEGLLNMISDEYITATLGNYLGFAKPFSSKFWPIFSEKKWSYTEGKNHDNVYSFMSDYHNIIWGLYRKDALYLSYATVIRADVKNDNLIEFILGVMLSYSGEIAFINKVWGVREVNTVDSWGRRWNVCALDTLQEEMSNKECGTQEAISFFASSGVYRKGYEGYECFIAKFHANLGILARVNNRLSAIFRRYIGLVLYPRALRKISLLIRKSEQQ